MRPEDESQYAMFLHLSALAGLIIGFFFLGPLILWLVKKDESPFVDRHGRTALNFHLSVLVYMVAAGLLMLVVAVATLGIGLLVLLPVFIIVAIAAMVAVIALPIVACLRAQAGQEYTYPLSIRFLSERPPPAGTTLI
jgi:uncharacterized protein